MTNADKWELCKPILLSNDWTQEEVDNIDLKTKKKIIKEISNYLAKKAKEKHDMCQAINLWAFEELKKLTAETEFMEHDWELEKALITATQIDIIRWTKIKEILGEEGFKRFMSDES
jgi:hypothetical protein